MEKYLYKDLYELEESHWWHISKRKTGIELIRNFLRVKKPKILDIGCGTGKNLEILSALGTAWGIDISKEAIIFCKKRGLDRVSLCTAERTNFPSSSFDLVTLFDVLEHTNDEKSISEIFRILKSNGLVILTVPAFSFLWSNWDVVLKHRKRYTKKSLKTILERRGFKIKKISYMYSFLILPVFIIRLIKSSFYENFYPSDFKLSSPLINRTLLKLTDFERTLIKNCTIPFGTSLVCVAEKTNPTTQTNCLK